MRTASFALLAHGLHTRAPRLNQLVIAIVALVAISVCNPAHAVELGLNGEVSSEWLKLPGVQYTHIIDVTTFAPNNLVSKDQDHDGHMNGSRLDLSWGTRTTFFSGLPFTAGIKGYYALHDGDQTASCTSLAFTSLCAHDPLFDPNPITGNTIAYSPGTNVVTMTDISTTTWGVALEGQTTSMKSSVSTLNVKAGSGYRRIDTALSLDGRGVSGLDVGFPYTLRENIGTGYLGGYVGAVAKLPLGDDFALSLDSEVGLYWAHTDYSGRYIQTGNAPFPGDDDQSLSLTRDTTTVIAALKVGLDKNFGAFKMGIFARGEYYSYAPEIQYNDIDRCCGFVFGGRSDGTSVDAGDAWTASIGGRVTIPIGQ